MNWIWGKLASLVAFFAAREIKRDQLKKDADASVQPLKDAVTGDEIDKAAKDALNGF